MSVKFSFSAHQLKHGLAMAKLVKPSSGDFVIRFDKNGVILYSTEKRRLALIKVAANDLPEVENGWTSEEYCMPAVKMSLFDPDLDSVVFSLTDNAMIIQASEGKQTRKATVKRRADSTRRTLIPTVRWGELVSVNADKFGRLLRMVGCSALVRETKTEEEMRVNQVHFYSDTESAASNARYHASVAALGGMKLDLSIVGSDIPIIRSFCAKLEGMVGLYQDKHKLYVVDESTNSALSFGRVVAIKPDFMPPPDEYGIDAVLNKEQLLSGLDWALAALDGTQRLSCETEDDTLKMLNNGEIFSMPISFRTGKSLRADLPARFLRTVVAHTDSDDVRVRFGNTHAPAVLEVSDTGCPDIQVRHYLQAMRSR